MNFRADHLKKHIVSHVNNTIPLHMGVPILGGVAGAPEAILELISKEGNSAAVTMPQ